jgi:hypothetical protein
MLSFMKLTSWTHARTAPTSTDEHMGSARHLPSEVRMKHALADKG